MHKKNPPLKFIFIFSTTFYSWFFHPHLAISSEVAKREPTKIVIFAGEALLIPGQAPIKGVIIEIIDDKIIKIQSHRKKPTPANSSINNRKFIDLSCCFVMPGFIDTHVHLTTSHLPDGGGNILTTTAADLSISATINARKTVMAGFTTVMDMGTGHRDHELAIYAVRDFISRGLIPGPEILAAGSPISITGNSRTENFRIDLDKITQPEGVCDSPDSCRFRVREQINRGADFINVYNTGSLLSDNSIPQTFSNEELATIAKTANMLNRVVVADGGNSISNAAGVNNAIKEGFSIIDTVTYPDNQSFKLLKKNGGYFAPHVYALIAAVGDSPETLEQGSMGWLPRPVLEKLYGLKMAIPSALAGYKMGATLILSSDSGVFPHGDNAHELVAYVNLGISITDSLKAATINAAKAYHIDHRTGSLEPGKEADIIALKENPFQNIKTVLDVAFVMSNGHIHREHKN